MCNHAPFWLQCLFNINILRGPSFLDVECLHSLAKVFYWLALSKWLQTYTGRKCMQLQTPMLLHHLRRRRKHLLPFKELEYYRQYTGIFYFSHNRCLFPEMPGQTRWMQIFSMGVHSDRTQLPTLSNKNRRLTNSHHRRRSKFWRWKLLCLWP